MGSSELNMARMSPRDEFYTEYKDIEAELRCYDPAQFYRKTVLLNCDDPHISQFWKYFHKKYYHFGLRKLTCSCYKRGGHGFSAEYSGEGSLQSVYTNGVRYFSSDGSFDSPDGLQMLDHCDIVVTNPPFSRFRDFLSLLLEKKKKFIIMGNLCVLSYKDCFRAFMDGSVRIGPSIHSGDREFLVPDSYEMDMTPVRTENDGSVVLRSGRIDPEGRKFIRVKGVRWFTNMDFMDDRRSLSFDRTFSKDDYPAFDNYPQAVNVRKTRDIPGDYDGIMGVPLSFIDHWNPDEYEIIGNEYTLGISKGRAYVGGRRQFARIFIKRKHKKITAL